MENKKLYYKDEKGRLREYKEPKTDNALYRKVGKRYEPVGMCDAVNAWGEGVYAVIKKHIGKHIIEEQYMRKIFRTCKCGDISDVSVSKLGGMTKLADWLCKNWGEVTGDSVYERCASIVGILMRYDDEHGK